MKPYRGIFTMDCAGKSCPEKLKNMVPSCIDCKSARTKIMSLKKTVLYNSKRRQNDGL